MENLSMAVNSKLPMALKNASLMRARFDLLNVCLDKVTDYLCVRDPQCGDVVN